MQTQRTPSRGWIWTLAAAMVLAGPSTAAAGEGAEIQLDFFNVNPNNPDRESGDPEGNRQPGFGYSGGVWTDPNGTDVKNGHNFGSNPDTQGTPLGDTGEYGNGAIAGQWGFEVEGSTNPGKFDSVLNSSNPVTFDASWDGKLLDDAGDEIDIGEIFFSHTFSSGSDASSAIGEWVQNNNSGATPGTTVDPVFTNISGISTSGQLTGQTGTFAFVANSDPTGTIGTIEGLSGSGSGDNDVNDAAFVSTSGSGSVSVPVPASIGLLGAGLVGLGVVARRRHNA